MPTVNVFAETQLPALPRRQTRVTVILPVRRTPASSVALGTGRWFRSFDLYVKVNAQLGSISIQSRILMLIRHHLQLFPTVREILFAQMRSATVRRALQIELQPL